MLPILDLIQRVRHSSRQTYAQEKSSTDFRNATASRCESEVFIIRVWHTRCLSIGMAKVLVVDDDPDMRAVMMEALQVAGHEVSSAANGLQGVHYALFVRPDLVVVDLFMPVQEGLETIRQLRQRLPYLPILAISGRHIASSPMLTVALQMGAVNVLEKPFDALTLRAAVEATLETRAHCKPPEVLANQSAQADS